MGSVVVARAHVLLSDVRTTGTSDGNGDRREQCMNEIEHVKNDYTSM